MSFFVLQEPKIKKIFKLDLFFFFFYRNRTSKLLGNDETENENDGTRCKKAQAQHTIRGEQSDFFYVN